MPANVIQLRPQTQVVAANDDDDGDPFYGREPEKLSKLRRDYNDYLDAKSAENAEMAEARRYYHGVQWDQEEVSKLNARNQPVITFNRISRKINGVVGLLERLRQDPKCYPRTPAASADEGAEIATQTLMYGLDVAKWRTLSPECGRHGAIGGLSGCELIVEQGDQGDPDILLGFVDQREFFYDPTSSAPDFSDAGYMGTARWIRLDVAIARWPHAEQELRDLASSGFGGDDGDDYARGDERRGASMWVSGKKRLRIVDHWYLKDDDWLYCIYSGDVLLEEGLSPFVDEKGSSVEKYLMFSANVDHEDDRYGFFRDLRGPQDEVNHRRSKALHLLNTRRIIAEKGAVDDPELARREVARSDGYIEKNKDYAFEVENVDTDFQGNVDLLAEAKKELDDFGPSQALLGQNIDTKSGRAISLLQQAGIAELGPFILAYKDWKLRVYRALYNAQQQFWTAERFIRVTDNEGLAQFVQINGWQRDQFGRPVLLNQLAAIDVDIVLDEGPDQINTLAEAFDTLLALAQQGANIPPQVIIELSNLPASIKKKVMGYIQQAQQPDPITLQIAATKLAAGQAEIGKTKSETAKNLASAQHLQAQAVTAGATPQQVDTPADLAKATKDLAQAHEIMKRSNRDASPDSAASNTRNIAGAMKDMAHAGKMAAETEALQSLQAQGFGQSEAALAGPGLTGMRPRSGPPAPGPRPLAPSSLTTTRTDVGVGE